MRWFFQTLAFLLVLPAVSCLSVSAASPDREKSLPNVVLIFADDLGYGDLGCFGNTVHRIPNLDQLAEDGVRLTSFYGAPCCTPSRAQLMTGSYARRVGLNDGPQAWVLLPKDPIGLNQEELTLAELLKGQGYQTACVGKWHLGDQLHLRNGKLYNLSRDVAESNDVAADRPEIVAQLTALADRMRSDLGDGSPEYPGVNQRQPGRVLNPRRLIEHDGTVASDVR